ncbi:MAG TPA: tetratricopeptide repeat protein [Thermoguttaceae bacterium]|nr:tetratricopeptide repeat protein [Thermoguttaceae bacterium]
MSDECRGVGPEHRNVDALQQQARAVLERCRSDAGAEEDLDVLEEILQRLPGERCLYERGYVAYQRGQDEEAAEYLYRAGWETFEGSKSPPPCEEVYPWILPFIIEPLPELWCQLAAEFRKAWPDSAAFCLLRGYAELYNDPETAVKYFADCLQADAACWPAAAEMGNMYFDAKKWKWAFDCYEHALPYAPAGEQSILHFNAALCMNRLEEWRLAAEHYAACLKRDPEFEYARANLGKCLTRCGEYVQAVEVLDEAIQRGEGSYEVRRSLAASLRRLRRFPEAAEVLRGGPRGKPH